jgi:hypothetical protein
VSADSKRATQAVFVFVTVVFACIAILNLRNLSDVVQAAMNRKKLVAVPAQVLKFGSSAVHGLLDLRVTYSYKWEGSVRESSMLSSQSPLGPRSRVFRPDQSENEWRSEWLGRIVAAHEGRIELTAWVDPVRPWLAVLDPNIRWTKVRDVLLLSFLFSLPALFASHNFFSGRARLK